MLNEIINNKLKEVNQLRETLDISGININSSKKIISIRNYSIIKTIK